MALLKILQLKTIFRISGSANIISFIFRNCLLMLTTSWDHLKCLKCIGEWADATERHRQMKNKTKACRITINCSKQAKN